MKNFLIIVLIFISGCESAYQGYYSLSDKPQLVYESLSLNNKVDYPTFVFTSSKELRWPFYASMSTPMYDAVACDTFKFIESSQDDVLFFHLLSSNDKYRYELYTHHTEIFMVPYYDGSNVQQIMQKQKILLQRLRERKEDINCKFIGISEYNADFIIPLPEYIRYLEMKFEYIRNTINENKQ